MFKRKMTVGLLAAAMIASVLSTGASHAAVTPKGTLSGGGVLTVHCVLPAFPTDTVGKATCPTGTIIGGDAGFNNGPNGKKSFAVNYCILLVPCTVTAVANYLEPCNSEGLVGAARGALTITGPGLKPPPKPLTQSSTLKVPFDWFRVGLVAIIETGKLATPGAKPHPVKIIGQGILDLIGNIPPGPAASFPGQKDWTKGNKHKVFADGKTQQDQQGGLAVAVFVPNGVPGTCIGGGGGPLAIDVVSAFVNFA